MVSSKNHINLRQVEIFRATMKFGTVTAAAAALGSSQPTITRELSRLEEHIGFHLFERRLQRLIPTARALKLFEEVQASFIGLDRINGFIERLRDASEEVLTVASLPAFAQTILPEAIARLNITHPDLTLHLSTVDPRNQSSISGFNFDIGLIEDFYTQRDAEVRVLWVFKLVAVMPPDHPLAHLTCSIYRQYLTSLFSRQYLTGNINIFTPRVLRFPQRCFHISRLANARQFNQHRQINTCDNLNPACIQYRNRQIRRCSAEHIRQNNNTLPLISFFYGRDNILTTLLHIIIGTDTNGFEIFLRADNMLNSMMKLFGQPSVRNKHESDHYKTAPADRFICQNGTL